MKTFWHALVVVMLYCSQASSQWAVFDASTFTQSTIQAIEAVRQTAQQAAQYARQAQQLYAQYQSINYQVQNLARLDANSIYAVLALSQQVTGVLRHADGMSYELDQALKEFDRLYPELASIGRDASGVLNTAQAVALHGQMRQARWDAARVSTQLSSVNNTMWQINRGSEALLRRAHAAQGAHDLGQVQAAQEALTQGIITRVEEQLAVANRVESQRQAEAAIIEQTQQQILDAQTSGEWGREYTGGRIHSITGWGRHQ